MTACVQEKVLTGILCCVIFLGAWKQVFEMVQEARIDRLLKLVPFAGAVFYFCFLQFEIPVVSL